MEDKEIKVDNKNNDEESKQSKVNTHNKKTLLVGGVIFGIILILSLITIYWTHSTSDSTHKAPVETLPPSTNNQVNNESNQEEYIVIMSNSSTNVRSTPKLGPNNIIGEVISGKILIQEGEKNDWVRITYKDQVGWVEKKNTSIIPKPKYAIVHGTNSYLNMRSNPEIENDNIVGKFYDGDVLEILEGKPTWFNVKHKDQTGWIHRDYLTIVNNENFNPNGIIINQLSYGSIPYPHYVFTLPEDINIIKTEVKGQSESQLIIEQPNTALIFSSTQGDAGYIELTKNELIEIGESVNGTLIYRTFEKYPGYLEPITRLGNAQKKYSYTESYTEKNEGAGCSSEICIGSLMKLEDRYNKKLAGHAHVECIARTRSDISECDDLLKEVEIIIIPRETTHKTEF